MRSEQNPLSGFGKKIRSVDIVLRAKKSWFSAQISYKPAGNDLLRLKVLPLLSQHRATIFLHLSGDSVPLHDTPMTCRSSQNVIRQVVCGLHLDLFPSSLVQFTETFAGLTSSCLKSSSVAALSRCRRWTRDESSERVRELLAVETVNRQKKRKTHSVINASWVRNRKTGTRLTETTSEFVPFWLDDNPLAFYNSGPSQLHK